MPAFKQGGGRELDWDGGHPAPRGSDDVHVLRNDDPSAVPRLSEDERVKHKGELIYPNLMVSLSSDHVVAFTVWPLDAGHTRIDCDFLFHPDEIAKPGFSPADAVDFWDLVNRQDWEICASVQKGMSSRVFSSGYYAPMEGHSASTSGGTSPTRWASSRPDEFEAYQRRTPGITSERGGGTIKNGYPRPPTDDEQRRVREQELKDAAHKHEDEAEAVG